MEFDKTERQSGSCVSCWILHCVSHLWASSTDLITPEQTRSCSSIEWETMNYALNSNCSRLWVKHAQANSNPDESFWIISKRLTVPSVTTEKLPTTSICSLNWNEFSNAHHVSLAFAIRKTLSLCSARAPRKTHLTFVLEKHFFFDCEAFYRLHISEKFIPKPEHEMPLNPPQKSALHTLANWNRQPRV